METIYKKLIRDNIPEIIAAKGQMPVIRALDDNEYLNALNQKLHEEVSEYLEDNCLEELCDIFEVAYAIARIKGYSDKDIKDCRDAKNLKNGAFNKKLFLEKVIAECDESEVSANEIQYIFENDPSTGAIEQLVSLIRAYAGEFFTDDFARIPLSELLPVLSDCTGQCMAGV